MAVVDRGNSRAGAQIGHLIPTTGQRLWQGRLSKCRKPLALDSSRSCAGWTNTRLDRRESDERSGPWAKGCVAFATFAQNLESCFLPGLFLVFTPIHR